MAVRIAQDQGLMLDAGDQLPSSDREERHRVFWSIYLLDRLVSCGRGRPPAIVDSSCHLQLPIDDAIWKQERWSKTPTLDELTSHTMVNSERQGHFAHVVVMAYSLGRGAQYMLQDFNIRSRQPPWDPSSDFAAIESDLLHLETRLDTSKSVQEILAPCIDEYGVVDHQRVGPIMFSRALFHLSYCMLNHPFLLRRRLENSRMSAPSSFLARTNHTGWLHAQNMLELICLTRNLGCVFQSSFCGYCITVAGSIALLHVRSGDSELSSRAWNLVHEAISYLEDIGRYWNNVSTMVGSLECLPQDAKLELLAPCFLTIMLVQLRHTFCAKRPKTRSLSKTFALLNLKLRPCLVLVQMRCGDWWTTAQCQMKQRRD